MLQLYGASGRVIASTVELDITYKQTEAGVDKTFIASFTERGRYYRAPFVLHDGVGQIEQMIAINRYTYKYLTLTVGTGSSFDTDEKGIQGRNVQLIGPTGVTFTSENQIPDDRRLQ